MSSTANPFVYFIRFLRLALGGLLIIGTAQSVVNSHKKVEVKTVQAIAYYEQLVAEGVPTISSDRIGLEHEGKFVHIQGILDTGSVTDPLTGATFRAINPSMDVIPVGLRRTVEMRQWTTITEGVSRQRSVRFVTVWRDRLLDSDGFKTRDFLAGQGQVHINPKQWPHETGFWIKSSQLMIDAWPVELSYTANITHLGGITPNSLKFFADNWQASHSDYLVPIGQAGEIGAFRISYDILSIPPGVPYGQYSAVGLVENGVISRPRWGNLAFDLRLLAPGNVSASTLLEQAIVKLHEDYVPSRNWIFFVFVGWLLCIGVLARFFPSFKNFTEASFPLRAVLTIVIAAIGTVLVGTFL